MHPLKIFLVYNWKWNNLATATAIWKLFYYYLINIYIGVNITKVLRWLAQHQTVSSAPDASARSGNGVTLSCARCPRCRVLCISSAGGDTIITSSRYLRHFLTTRSSFLHKYILRSAPRITDIVVATWLYILRVILCTYLSLLTSSWGAGVVNLKIDNMKWRDYCICIIYIIYIIPSTVTEWCTTDARSGERALLYAHISLPLSPLLQGSAHAVNTWKLGREENIFTKVENIFIIHTAGNAERFAQLQQIESKI